MKNEIGEASAALEVFDVCNWEGNPDDCVKRVQTQDVQNKTEENNEDEEKDGNTSNVQSDVETEGNK